MNRHQLQQKRFKNELLKAPLLFKTTDLSEESRLIKHVKRFHIFLANVTIPLEKSIF